MNPNSKFVIVLSCCLQSFCFAQTKRALIVAIGTYESSTGWAKISSQNDVPLIRKVLEQQDFKDIEVLADKNATKSQVLKTLEKLDERCEAGDKIVLHFSTHGQQITDNDGDEIDGFDEAIICYDTPADTAHAPANYRGEKHLRDDELGEILGRIRRKIGKSGEVLLIADACHAGTNTRGNAIVRGSAVPYIFRGGSQNLSSDNIEIFMGQNMPTDTSLAPLIALAACKAKEQNEETLYVESSGRTISVGSLTLAFCEALKRAKAQDSYRSLFARIQQNMASKNQSPEIEGDMDKGLFGGDVVQQQTYFTVKKINKQDRTLQINAGRLNGLQDSTRIVICPLGTQQIKTASRKIFGTIIKCQANSAIARLDTILTDGREKNWWVFPKERPINTAGVGIITDSLRVELKQSIETAFGKAIAKTPAELYFFEANPNQIGAKRLSDKGLAILPQNTNANFKTLSQQIENYNNMQLWRSLESEGEQIKCSMDLLPLKTQGERLRDTLQRKSPEYRKIEQNGWLKFLGNGTERAALLIKNEGEKGFYFTVIDMMPDNSYQILFPEKGKLASDYFIEAHKSKHIIFGFAPPFGTETYLLLATPEPLNLAARLSGEISRGAGEPANVLDKIFGKKQMGERGGTIYVAQDENNFGVYQLHFKIVEKR